MATQIEVVRTVLARVPKYQHPDNEKALALACAADGKPVTVENVIAAYSRLRDSGQLVENALENHALEEFYDDHQWWDVRGNDSLLNKTETLTVEHLEREAYRLGDALAVAEEYANGWREFIGRRPEFSGRGTAANRNLAFSLLGLYQPPTADALEEIANRVPCPLAKSPEYQAQQQDEQERQAIITAIVGSLKVSVDGRGRRVCTDVSGRTIVVHKEEVELIQSMSLPELRQIRDSRAEAQRLRALPKEELHAVVRQQEQAQRQAAWDSRFPKLPTTYVPRGQVVAVPLDAVTLKRMDIEELRRVKKIYGDEQLNARLRGEN